MIQVALNTKLCSSQSRARNTVTVDMSKNIKEVYSLLKQNITDSTSIITQNKNTVSSGTSIFSIKNTPHSNCSTCPQPTPNQSKLTISWTPSIAWSASSSSRKEQPPRKAKQPLKTLSMNREGKVHTKSILPQDSSITTLNPVVLLSLPRPKILRFQRQQRSYSQPKPKHEPGLLNRPIIRSIQKLRS